MKSISKNGSESSEEEPSISEVEIVDLDDTLQPFYKKTIPSKLSFLLFAYPFGRRRRLRRILMTVGIYGLAILLLLVTYAPTRTVMDTLFIALLPPSVRPLPLGSDLFFIRGTPVWGQLSVDGQVLKRLPTNGLDDPLQLAKGQHTLAWTTPPVGTQYCTLSVPPDKQDGCWANLSQGPWNKKSGSVTVWYLSFSSTFPSLNHFPGLQVQEILSSIQANLDAATSTTTVQSGDAYALNAHTVIAQQPLRARLHYLLNNRDNSEQDCIVLQQVISGCMLQGVDCHLLCDPTLMYPTLSSCHFNCNSNAVTDHLWNVLIVVRTVWDYTTPSGQVIALNQPDYSLDNIPAKATLLLKDEHSMLVQLSHKNGHWQSQLNFESTVNLSDLAADSSLNPVCASAWSEKSTRRELRAVPVPHQGDTIQWRFISGPTPAEGCLAYISVIMTSDQPAYLLHRFGIFLTANLVANLIWPELPVMRPSLRPIVNQLVNILPPAERIPSTR